MNYQTCDIQEVNIDFPCVSLVLDPSSPTRTYMVRLQECSGVLPYVFCVGFPLTLNQSTEGEERKQIAGYMARRWPGVSDWIALPAIKTGYTQDEEF